MTDNPAPADNPPVNTPQYSMNDVPEAFTKPERGKFLSSDVKQKPLNPVTRVGYKLALFLFWLLAGFLVINGIYTIVFIAQQPSLETMIQAGTPKDKPLTPEQVQEITKLHTTYSEQTQKLLVEQGKTIFLNLLLPIITAILGYIFASTEKNTENNDNSNE